MIEIQNVSFGYKKGQEIFENISCHMHKNEITAILGGSGCGKSTMLRLIAGLLPYDKENICTGKILVDGKEPVQFRMNDNLSFMFQEATLLPNITVAANIAFPIKMRKKLQTDIIEYLELVGLTKYSDMYPFELSGGMKTRVALAQAFINKPNLLLLDEPFSSLDVAWKRRLYGDLLELHRINKSTIVIVTHDIDEALLLADKIIVLGNCRSVVYETRIIKNQSNVNTNSVDFNKKNYLMDILMKENERL